MKKQIEVCWTRRISPKAAATTDEDGFVLMEFAFNDGRRISVMAVRQGTCAESCMWQRIPFGSPGYLTKVEWWETREGMIYIYAEPSDEIKAKL